MNPRAKYLLLILLTASLRWAGAQLPPAQSGDDIERELGIMAKVLEESLDRSSLEGWHWVRGSVSAFDPRVRYEYYPSVGAVFTIPVGFPVIDRNPTATAAEPKEPPRETDLWEKHSSPDAERSQDIEFDGALEVVPMVTESVRKALEDAGVAIDDTFDKEPWKFWKQWDKGGDAPANAFVRHASYDEQKVMELRRVLIDSFARYGHRMEHLPANEKIILAIESPGGRSGGMMITPQAFINMTPPPVPVAPMKAPETPAPRARIAPSAKAARPDGPAPPGAPAPEEEMIQERIRFEEELAETETKLAEEFGEAQVQVEEAIILMREELNEAIGKGEVEKPDEARASLEQKIAALHEGIGKRADLARRTHERRVEIARDGADRKERVTREVRLKRAPTSLVGARKADRYVIVIGKGDIGAAVSFEDLSPKVQEFRQQN